MNTLISWAAVLGTFLKVLGAVLGLVGVVRLFLAYRVGKFGGYFDRALMLVALSALLSDTASFAGLAGVLLVLVWMIVRQRYFTESRTTEN